jgi:hypothetical protein
MEGNKMADSKGAKKAEPLILKLDHAGLGVSEGIWKVVLAATLSQGNKFLADRVVKFFVNFLLVGEAKTTEDGIARFSYEGVAKPTHAQAVLDGTTKSACVILQHPVAMRLRRDKITITPHGSDGKYSLSVSVGTEDYTPIKGVEIRVFSADISKMVKDDKTNENGQAFIKLPRFGKSRKKFFVEIETLPAESITLKGPKPKNSKANNRRAIIGWVAVAAWLCFNASVIGISPNHSTVAEITTTPAEAGAYYERINRYNNGGAQIETAKRSSEIPTATWKDRWRLSSWFWSFVGLIAVAIYTPIAFREETLYPLLDWLRDWRANVSISRDLPDPKTVPVAGSQQIVSGVPLTGFLRKFFSGTWKFVLVDLAIEVLEKIFEHKAIRK